MGRNNMNQWTIQRKVLSLALTGILIFSGILAFSYYEAVLLKAGFENLLVQNKALGYAGSGDMMHDALRGDVLNALVSETEEDFSAVKADVQEHSKNFMDYFNSLNSLNIDQDTKNALSEVMPVLQKYTKAAIENVELATKDKEAAKANLSNFLIVFGELEEKLEKMSELVSSGFDNTVANQQAAQETNILVLLCTAAAGFPFLIFLSFLISRSVNKSLSSIVEQFTSIAEQISRGVEQLNDSSRSLAEASSKQAASLEETAASLEEVSSMARQTADNSQQAKVFSVEVEGESKTGVTSMRQMAMAIDSIKTSAEETASIIKTIDEIAFQTNLLALNAAVEAARAGDAGKGFAVVAEEVRALAQRSSSAAKDTSEKIRRSRELADNGVKVSQEVRNSLETINERVGKTSTLVNEIAAASQEQSIGLREVNKAASQLDQATQANSAQAEELAAAAHEMVMQTKAMEDATRELYSMVYGTKEVNKAAKPRKERTKSFSSKETPKMHNKNLKNPTPPTTIRELNTPLPTEYELKNSGKNLTSTVRLNPEEIIPLDDGDFQGF